MSERGLLQRRCACGNHARAGDGCAECEKNKRVGLQTKLPASRPGDVSEQEADRIADQVMSPSGYLSASGTPPRIQRFPGQPTGLVTQVPASVGQALAGSGQPLEPALRQDMEQRLGHDFSRVRVHSGAAAEQSARDLHADAYTMNHDIVFGAGRLAPGTPDGRRLLAHELTHVVQQRKGAGASVQRAPEAGRSSPSLTVLDVDIRSSDPNCQYQPGERDRSDTAKGVLDYDIEKAEFFGIEPADAVVIADFRVDHGELRPSTESDFRKFWNPSFDKSSLSAMEIVGFNDCVGWESRNKRLREARARAVARLLPGVESHAAPFDEYLVANTSERGRALNRSVIIRPKPQPPPPPPPPRKREVTITMEEPPTKDCSPEQRRQLSIAFPAAKLMAERARAALFSTDKGPVLTFLLDRFFGEDALTHLGEIHAGFSKILDDWTDWDPRFDCEKQTEARCPSDDPHFVKWAYVMKKRRVFSPNSPFGVVHVCEAAFGMQNNMQILSATILHELSHRLDSTNDRKYCWPEKGWCSSLSTKEAIDNADSYAQFARQLFNSKI